VSASPALVTTVDVLKALADQTRLRIMNLVVAAGDLCACEIEVLLGVNQSNLSRHITRLQQAGVLEAEKRGTWMHYRPTAVAEAAGDQTATAGEQTSIPPAFDMTDAILRRARAESAELTADLARLAEYRASGRSCRTIRAWRPGQTIPNPARRRTVNPARWRRR
jgi:DNA-binding transcriptional ArsR family regulator